MRCSWLLCFYYYQTIVLFVGRTIFVKFKPMLFRWFLCFSHSKQCFFDGSYAFHIETYVFSLVPTLFAFKPLLFYWFLRLLFIKPCVFVCSYVVFIIKPMSFRWPLCFFMPTIVFLLFPVLCTIKPVFVLLVPMVII